MLKSFNTEEIICRNSDVEIKISIYNTSNLIAIYPNINIVFVSSKQFQNPHHEKKKNFNKHSIWKKQATPLLWANKSQSEQLHCSQMYLTGQNWNWTNQAITLNQSSYHKMAEEQIMAGFHTPSWLEGLCQFASGKAS